MNKKLLLLLIAIFIVPSCSAKDKMERVVMGNQSIVLSDSQLQIKMNEALDGSGEAASAIANYYLSVKMDYEKALYWLQIAAENGDIESMHSYWVIASQSQDEDEKRRASFWQKKSTEKRCKNSQNP